MRRGNQLELQISRWIKKLLDKGIYAQKNHAKRLQDGTFVSGEAFDYLIISKGKIYCFDSKESATEKWYLHNAKIHQIKYLKICKNNGAEAFFLVYFFPGKTLIKFDVDVIIQCLSNGKKYLKQEEGIVFDYEFIAMSRD